VRCLWQVFNVNMNFLGAYGSAPTNKKETASSSSAVPPHPPVSLASVPLPATPLEETKVVGTATTIETKRRIEVPEMLDAATIHRELERRLPPEPPQSEADPDACKKVAAAVAANQTVVTRLKNHTAFKNPEIMAQLVKYVNETGFYVCCFEFSLEGFVKF